MGSVCLDGARFLPAFRSGQLGACLQQGGGSSAVGREGVAAGCHGLSGYSDEEFGDTTVHLLPVLRSAETKTRLLE